MPYQQVLRSHQRLHPKRRINQPLQDPHYQSKLHLLLLVVKLVRYPLKLHQRSARMEKMPLKLPLLHIALPGQTQRHSHRSRPLNPVQSRSSLQTMHHQHYHMISPVLYLQPARLQVYPHFMYRVLFYPYKQRSRPLML